MFFQRIANAWSLAKSSWAVLQRDRELALLPVVGGIMALVVALVFFGPAAFFFEPDSESIPLASALFGLAGYIAVSTMIFISRAAVIHGANERMDGGDPTVGSGLGGAFARWPAVAGFAAISVTVGLILDAIEDQGFLGAIASFIGGAAWRVLTYLVLPVIVLEQTSAVQGIKQSSALVKRTWGEQVSGNVGFGLLSIIAALPGIALVVIGSSLGGPGLILVLAGVVAVIASACVVTTLQGIFQTALYRQATGRSVPLEFDQAALAGAISPVGRRR